MPTPQDIITTANTQIGVTNTTEPYRQWYIDAGHAPNTPYWRTQASWCAIFISWLFAHHNMHVLGLPHAYVPTITAAQSSLRIPKHQAQPGDLAIFDWNKDSNPDHIGLVTSTVTNNTITTIEGNTSPTNGSQTNGGTVAKKTRNLNLVKYITRPTYTTTVTNTTQKGKKMIFIMRPDEQNKLIFFDGTHAHDVANPDEAKAIREIYHKIYNAPIPEFDYGTATAPWAARFLDAVNRGATWNTFYPQTYPQIQKLSTPNDETAGKKG